MSAVLAVLDRRLDAKSASPLAVGLSGGSDSLALLLLARRWTNRTARPLLAFTVDHQLHADSGRWTAQAGDAARQLGVNWRPLAWTGPKPATGLPAAARQARHTLLADAARAAGARVLLLGHTASDVAESALIRNDTPSHGWLQEWAPSPVWPAGRGLFLLRPLLAARRAELQDWLAAQGLTWLDDPANTDLRFARPRARVALAASLQPPSPVRPPGRMAEPAHRNWHVDDCGGLDLEIADLEGREATDTLAKALLCVAGGVRPPGTRSVGRLLARRKMEAAFTTTLAGTRVALREGRFRLTREMGRHPPLPMPLAVGMGTSFDGRFELEADACGWCAAPLAGRAAGLPRSERAALQDLPADARPSLPVLLSPDGEARLPAPFGGGPASAKLLVGDRLAAALGLITSEQRLELAPAAVEPRSAGDVLILS